MTSKQKLIRTVSEIQLNGQNLINQNVFLKIQIIYIYIIVIFKMFFIIIFLYIYSIWGDFGRVGGME
jgi:hypothetical protein